MEWKRFKTLLPIAGVAIGLAAGAPVWGANTTARPGTINYVEGRVFLDGQELTSKSIGTAELNTGQVLDTEQGKAEILLTPGVFLRVGDGSQVRMDNPGLTNTSVAVTRGEALLDATMLLKENNVQIADAGTHTSIEKNGLYRFTADANPAVSVIDGKAVVREGDRTVEVKKGRQLFLNDPNGKPQKFDRAAEDDLYAWSKVRSEYMAEANAANVRYVLSGGMSWYGPGWYWSPWYGSYAFMPGGAFLSPFGYSFYSPFYNPWYYGGVVVAPRYYRSGGWYHGGRVGVRAGVGRQVAPSTTFRSAAPRISITPGPAFGRAGIGGFRGGFAHR